jgi:hypothetical protein
MLVNSLDQALSARREVRRDGLLIPDDAKHKERLCDGGAKDSRGPCGDRGRRKNCGTGAGQKEQPCRCRQHGQHLEDADGIVERREAPAPVEE